MEPLSPAALEEQWKACAEFVGTRCSASATLKRMRSTASLPGPLNYQ